MKKLYLLLTIVGFVLPYYSFVSFLTAHGLNLQLLFSQLFANNISSFFAVDLIVTAIVFWVFLYREGGEGRWETGGYTSLPHWWLAPHLHCRYSCTFVSHGLRSLPSRQSARRHG